MDISGTRVLIVDDDASSQRLLAVRLRALGCEVMTAGDGGKALPLIQKELPALMLLDLEMPGMGGLEVLRALRSNGLELSVIVITAHSTIENAVEAIKEGAYDFIPKPIDPEHLEIVVRKALEQQRLKKGVEILAEEVGERYHLVAGKSATTQQAVDSAKKAAASKATVLLLGESGTGKELFARAIHGWSERREEPFVAINCVGLSRELLESELFGHEKGAYTSADQLKKGKVEMAHGGTVFFDEIGDISPELQAKLLRFLQEREFERVGGTKSIRVDVRVLAATNRDLELAVKEGRFREDLYHRLNVIAITLPPLRERKKDIPSLALHFVRRFAKETKKNFTGIDAMAEEKIIAYPWPGNIRELGNVIERAVVLGHGPAITVEDLPSRIAAAAAGTQSENQSYREVLEQTKRMLIMRTLAQTQGNRAAAAKVLGVHEKYLFRLIKTLRIV